MIWSPKLQIPHMILVSKSCLLVFIKIRCVFSITGRWLAVRYGIQNFCESNVWKSFILLLLLLLLRCSLQRYFGRAVGMSENPRGASSNVVGITCLPGWNSVNWPTKIGRGGAIVPPFLLFRRPCFALGERRTVRLHAACRAGTFCTAL